MIVMATLFDAQFEREILRLAETRFGSKRLDDFFEFLLDNKHHVDERPSLKRVLVIRLDGLTHTDYKFRAYHYLYRLCDIHFDSYYDEDTDQCVEYYVYDNERHIVTY